MDHVWIQQRPHLTSLVHSLEAIVGGELMRLPYSRSSIERVGQAVGAEYLRRREAVEPKLIETSELRAGVRPEQRERGLGRQLLELAEARAAAAGFEAIHLYTHEKMVENRALYARLGYVQYDARTEEGFARVFMRKRLELAASSSA